MQHQTQVIFGAGPLARATARALLQRGLPVRLLSRHPQWPDVPVGIQLVQADLLSGNNILSHCQDAAALYFCAQPLYHQWPTKFEPLHTAAMHIAQTTGAKLIVAENLYGYGSVKGSVKDGLHEELPLATTTRKGRVRVAMHKALMEAHQAGHLRAAVARGADFFGAGVTDSAYGERLFQAIAQGARATVLGDPDAPRSFTYVEDFGAALALLGQEDRALGEVWHVPNAPALTTREWLQEAALLADQPLRLRRMGLIELRLLGLFIPPLREAIEMRYSFEQPQVVDSRKFVTTFGELATPTTTALKATLNL